jgi:hypothetical protein
VIGVIADMHHISISDDPVDEVYVPYTREVWPGIGLLIRARGEPLTLGPALRRALLGVEPDLPVLGSAGWRTFEPIGTYIDRLLAPRQLVLRLVLGFAGVAVALAAIGVYVVIAFGVAQRTREIGIRMAVGATTRDVMRLVLRQSLALATVGAVAGIIGGIAIARVPPRDTGLGSLSNVSVRGPSTRDRGGRARRHHRRCGLGARAACGRRRSGDGAALGVASRRSRSRGAGLNSNLSP